MQKSVYDQDRESSRTASLWRGTFLVVISAVPAATVAWGLSFPGFPMACGGLLLVTVAALVLLWVRWGASVVRPARKRGWWFGWALSATAIFLVGGLLAVIGSGDAPLRARWGASSAAFEAEVAVLGAPAPAALSVGGVYFDHLPGPCPSWIGRFSIGECWAVDRGYLFLQTQNAVTDSSGIVYLPTGNRPELSGLNPEDLTALGGPWWAWTCNC